MLPDEDYVQLQSNTANRPDYAAGNNRAVQPLNDREVHVYAAGEQGVPAPTDETEDGDGETDETDGGETDGGDGGEVTPGDEDPEDDDEDEGAFALAASTVAATAVLLAF